MEWRKCPNWPEYEVSECGDVRRIVKRFGFQGVRKPYLASNGRMMIVMRNKGKSKACHVHRLVLEAFIGPAPSSKHEGAHNDGNCLHNHISNLRWATRSENEMDKVLHGTSNRGEKFGRAVLTNIQAAEVKVALSKRVACAALAARYGTAASTIRSIKQGKSWSWMALSDALAILHYAISNEDE